MRVETIERKLYKFEELEKAAQEKALDKFREWACDDSHWYESVYDDAAAIFKILGIESEKRTPWRNLKIGAEGVHIKPGIWFSGFCQQGDGACFEGSYRYKAGASKAIREHAPEDSELHAIADRLAKVQRRNFYRLEATLTHSGSYYHENSVFISVQDSENPYREVKQEDESEVDEALRDLMRWIYRQLENEHDYLTSDEAIKENIESGEYEFTASGALA
jgi:hypothetical protein